MRIIHCMRAPVGGLFRHVRDLAEAQADAGHLVGIVADSSTGGDRAEAQFAALRAKLALGLTRVPMRRDVGLSDITATLGLRGPVGALNPDVLHTHGAKGGAYGRMVGTLLRATGKRVARIYTPHGGSLHYDPASTKGRVYFAAERLLGRMTDGFVFVSQFEADTYAAKIGKPSVPVTIALNGLKADEFVPVRPLSDAADFLFIGEMRDLKGPDVLIEALALIGRHASRTPTAVFVGSGPDRLRYETLVSERNLTRFVTFRDAMPARQAFALARNAVVPSRNESLPYIVLETIAAGLPLVTTSVGGIPEIYGAEAAQLVPPGDPEALADALMGLLVDPAGARADADRLKASVERRFTIPAMVESVVGAYAQVLGR